MAHQEAPMALTLIVVTMLWAGTSAQSINCNNVLFNLSPCLNNSTVPNPNCCSQLSSVIQSQPQCLCQLINGGGPNPGFNNNQAQILALANTCNIPNANVFQCNGIPGQFNNCTNVLFSVSPCLNNATFPSPNCCSQLSSTVQFQPQCLCQLLNGGSNVGFNTDEDQVQNLIENCNVPNANNIPCNGGFPFSSSGSTSNFPYNTYSGVGLVFGPSSFGAIYKLVHPMLFYLLFVSSYGSTFNVA